MSSKVFLPPLARLLMSSLFVWDGILQLRDPIDTAKFFATCTCPRPMSRCGSRYRPI
jgi:putative oxidoreductase